MCGSIQLLISLIESPRTTTFFVMMICGCRDGSEGFFGTVIDILLGAVLNAVLLLGEEALRKFAELSQAKAD
jgi:hypothetical protein